MAMEKFLLQDFLTKRFYILLEIFKINPFISFQIYHIQQIQPKFLTIIISFKQPIFPLTERQAIPQIIQ